jgi:hypothetical protein
MISNIVPTLIIFLFLRVRLPFLSLSDAKRFIHRMSGSTIQKMGYSSAFYRVGLPIIALKSERADCKREQAGFAFCMVMDV